MCQCKPKVYQYHVLINRLLTDTNPQGRKKCDAFIDNFRTTLGIQNYLRREVRMKDHEQATTIGW